jgi:hypothetical protein
VADAYGKVLEREWEDALVVALPDADYRVYQYLKSNRHRSLSGVYYLPIVTAAHELQRPAEVVELALYHRLRGLVTYDPATSEVFVHCLAADNMGCAPYTPLTKTRKGEDGRIRGIIKGLGQVRSAGLKHFFLTTYAAWDLGVPLPDVAPVEEAGQLTLVQQGEGAPTPPLTPPLGPVAVSSSSKQVTDSSSSADRSNDLSGKPGGFFDRQEHREAAQLMPMVRRHLYVDGVPPVGYTEGRDFEILAELLRETPIENLEVAIEGIAMMRDAGELEWVRPREKLTVRILRNTKHGLLDTLTLGANYFWQRHNQSFGRRQQQ